MWNDLTGGPNTIQRVTHVSVRILPHADEAQKAETLEIIMRNKLSRADLTAIACAAADDHADRHYGDDGIARTVEPTRVSTVRETVVLETPKARVIGRITPRGKDLAWLAAEVFSTDSAYRS